MFLCTPSENVQVAKEQKAKDKANLIEGNNKRQPRGPRIERKSLDVAALRWCFILRDDAGLRTAAQTDTPCGPAAQATAVSLSLRCCGNLANQKCGVGLSKWGTKGATSSTGEEDTLWG